MFVKFIIWVVVFVVRFAVANPYSLGQYAEGGVIFFLVPSMDHGLVAAISDQDDGSGISWGNNTTYVNSGFDGVFFGEDYKSTAGSLNTQSILAALGDVGAAATLCKNYSVTVDGVVYADWYLPSMTELSLMLHRREMIDAKAIENGGTAFEPVVYWSSLENINSLNIARGLSFDPANPYTQDNEKTEHYKVRAIRVF